MKKVNFKIGKSVILRKVGIVALVASIVVGGYSCEKEDDSKSKLSFTHEGHSYLIVKEKKNWQAAMEDAVKKGGYLVEIGNKNEQDAVYAAIVKNVSSTYTQVADGGGVAYVWIGGMDYYGEGTWIWNGDNESGNMPAFWIKNVGTVGYANWGKGEPDDYTNSEVAPNGQDFAAIGLEAWPKNSGSLGKAGEWNDIAGTNLLYYVVEFDSVKK
jgi:hypothetical protein